MSQKTWNVAILSLVAVSLALASAALFVAWKPVKVVAVRTPPVVLPALRLEEPPLSHMDRMRGFVMDMVERGYLFDYNGAPIRSTDEDIHTILTGTENVRAPRNEPPRMIWWINQNEVNTSSLIVINNSVSGFSPAFYSVSREEWEKVREYLSDADFDSGCRLLSFASRIHEDVYDRQVDPNASVDTWKTDKHFSEIQVNACEWIKSEAESRIFLSVRIVGQEYVFTLRLDDHFVPRCHQSMTLYFEPI